MVPEKRLLIWLLCCGGHDSRRAIKCWLVPDSDVLTGATAKEIWGSGKDENTTKNVKPILTMFSMKLCAVHRLQKRTMIPIF